MVKSGSVIVECVITLLSEDDKRGNGVIRYEV